jgi:nitroimidazol reductase NimA-like FMN-containing flavoprotein (pyridoxamine 5'-phosphate oxidase superfamily)
MKDMRKAERQMKENEALQLLNQGEYGILATADSQNQPYGIPLSYVVVNNFIYFHCAIEGHKLQNIVENNKVCFTVVGRTNVLPDKFSTEYESVVVFGQASIVEHDVEKAMVLKEFVKKYSSGFISEGDSYIDKAKNRVVVVKMTMQFYAGKHRKPAI